MKIAIDAGHGPHTPGKRSPDDALREFHFNAPVARYVASLLAEYEGVETLSTHDTSGLIDVPLQARTDSANLWEADILVSIHANAYGSGWNDSNGIETYVYTAPSDASVRLAEVVQRALVAATGLRNRGVKRGDLHMVRAARMPAILVECGYMTNRKEAALLMTDDYRRLCAQAIMDGIAEAYKLQRKQPAAPVPAPDAVTVIINGQRIADGFLRDGRAYVPARAVGDVLGMTVTWESATKTASLEGGE